jgi:hypothetical protein
MREICWCDGMPRPPKLFRNGRHEPSTCVRSYSHVRSFGARTLPGSKHDLALDEGLRPAPKCRDSPVAM